MFRISNPPPETIHPQDMHKESVSIYTGRPFTPLPTSENSSQTSSLALAQPGPQQTTLSAALARQAQSRPQQTTSSSVLARQTITPFVADSRTPGKMIINPHVLVTEREYNECIRLANENLAIPAAQKYMRLTQAEIAKEVGLPGQGHVSSTLKFARVMFLGPRS